MKMWFWLKLYVSNGYGAWRLLSEFLSKGWKVGSIDCLLKRIRKTGTIVWQPGIRRPRLVRSDDNIEKLEDLMVSQDEPKCIDQLVIHMKLPFSIDVHRIIHRDLQLHCFKRRSAQLLSEANCVIYLTPW